MILNENVMTFAHENVFIWMHHTQTLTPFEYSIGYETTQRKQRKSFGNIDETLWFR